jgi:hypothetical protein
MDIDHKKHFIICAIATLLAFGLHAPFMPFWHVFSMCPMLGLGLGIGKGYGDSRASGNRWDWTDMVAGILGIGAALVWLLLMHFIVG